MVIALTSGFTLAGAATLLVYGDSLSASYGIPQDKSWVTLLTQRLKNEKFDYTVANASISGETTLGGLKRIAATLDRSKPSVVVLELGANDGLRGLSLDTMRKNLEDIITACEKMQARVVLVGMRLPPNYGNAYADKFHTTFQEIAKRRKLALVPYLFEGFGDQPQWFQADGIHPTVEAQPLILETVWKVLRPALQSAPSRVK